MSKGTFDARSYQIGNQVGPGSLTGQIRVDQVYAARQHNELTWKHPRGGRARYLSAPYGQAVHEYLLHLARSILGGQGVAAMRRNMTNLARKVGTNAPILYNNLRRSASVTVTSGGAPVYHQPARVKRLTRQQLRQQRRRGARR